jgi:hypothetical protein
MTGILCALAGSGGGPGINSALSGITGLAANGNGSGGIPGVATMTVLSDGRLSFGFGGTGGSNSATQNWYLPTTTAIGSSWWVKANLVADNGDVAWASVPGTALGTWVQLTSGKTYSVSLNSSYSGLSVATEMTLSFSSASASDAARNADIALTTATIALSASYF